MKIKNIVLKFLMLIVMIFTVSSCSAPKEMVGKYNLTKITGLMGVSASTYDYNYIELNGDYTYHLENKVYGQVTAQDGTWTYTEETKELTFVCKVNESTYSKDIAIYDAEAKTFTISSTIQGYSISMTFTLEVAA